MSKRYEIDFAGSTGADTVEFFPDGPDEPDAVDLIRTLEDISLRVFLFDWLYAEDIEVTIRDRETGAVVVWDGVRNRFREEAL